MAWNDYNRVLENLGSFAAQLILKRQQEEAQRQAMDALSQASYRTDYKPEFQVPAPVAGQPTLPTRLPALMPQKVYDPNLARPEYAGAVGNMLATEGGAQNLANYLALQKANDPSYQFINQEGGGLQLGTIPPHGGKPSVETITQPIFQPKTGNANIDYRDLVAPDGKVHTYRFTYDNTGKQLSKDDLGETKQPSAGAGGANSKWTAVKDAMGATLGWVNPVTSEYKPITGFEGLEAGVPAPLTNSTKTMVESSPKVKDFVNKIRGELKTVETGPAASRWQEFWAGGVGTENKEFTKLRTDVGLLTTLLMRMHVGARGGEYIMQHFQDLLNGGKQSAANLNAALDQIESYANDVESEGRTGALGKKSGEPSFDDFQKWQEGK